MNANLTAQAPALDANDELLATLTGAIDGDGKHPCSCSDGCPQLTGRFFAQGHDARLVTRLRNAVTAGEMPIAEAFAEITKRGGTERLQIKLDAAVANSRKPAKKGKAKKSGKKAKVTTFELDGFILQTPPLTTRPIVAKIGRWENEGTLRTHRSGEEGATKEDTFMVFEYTNKKGELVETTKYKFVRDLPVAEVAEAPADDEAEALPVLVSLRGDAAAEAAREEVQAAVPERAFAINRPASEVGQRAIGSHPAGDVDTSDIPF